MNFYIKTLGCKLNQAESADLRQSLEKLGLTWSSLDQADLLILNACSVTQSATNKSLNIIKKFRENKSGQIVVMGCLEKKLISQVDYVVQDKEQAFLEIKNKFILYISRREARAGKKLGHSLLAEPNIKNNRNRAQIKIQTGCDNFCSYCVIPYFRGQPRSFSVSEIIKQIQQVEKQGIQEIVLTGVNICKYQFGKIDLAGLVKKILKDTKISRLRFGSLDPYLITPEFIKLFRDKRLMPSWHLSLQSGSDEILNAMNRKYSTQQYLDLYKKVLKIRPGFSLTTDVIVGFPGETDQLFQETIKFVKKVGFLKIHVFPYSKRPHTKAILMPVQVSEKTKIERSKVLRKLSLELTKKFIQKNLRKISLILIEGQKNDFWYGFTENFIRVKIKDEKLLPDQIVEAKLKKSKINFEYYH